MASTIQASTLEYLLKVFNFPKMKFMLSTEYLTGWKSITIKFLQLYFIFKKYLYSLILLPMVPKNLRPCGGITARSSKAKTFRLARPRLLLSVFVISLRNDLIICANIARLHINRTWNVYYFTHCSNTTKTIITLSYLHRDT